MKLITAKNGKQTIKLSMEEWEKIGKNAGWTSSSQVEKEERCRKCKKGNYQRNNSCGAKVCDECGDHKGLERCYCGWAADGGNGRSQLEEMGEVIDPDQY